MPGIDARPEAGAGGGAPTGAAGGVLSGTYPNPGMAAGAAATNVGTVAGDLSGTLPNPTVAKLNGVAAAAYALLASPGLTGVPTAPTATALTATTQLATTAYTDSAVGVETTRATTAEALKAPLASPTFTGTPAATTAAPGANSTQLATTAYADAIAALKLSLTGGTMSGAIAMGTAKITGLGNGSSAQDAAAFGQIPAALPPNGTAGGDLSSSYPNPTVAKLNGVAAASYALLASPALSGTPTAPTASASTGTTQIASTAYVDTADALKANLASPTFTGAPLSTTPATNDNSTKIATTAFVDALSAAGGLPIWAPFSGSFVSLPYYGSAPSSQTILATNGTIYYLPLIITNSPTVTQLTVRVTTAAGTGGVVRLGIFNDSSGKPGTVLLDAGTAATTTNTTTVTIGSLSTALTPGRYWVGVVAQGAASPSTTFLASGNAMGTLTGASLSALLTGTPVSYAAMSQASVTGSLATASTSTFVTSAAATMPVVVVTF